MGVYLYLRWIRTPHFGRDLCVQCLEASLNILWIEESLKQWVSCSEEKSVYGHGPDGSLDIVAIRVAVGDEWLDEMPPYNLVAKQPLFNETTYEPRRSFEGTPLFGVPY